MTLEEIRERIAARKPSAFARSDYAYGYLTALEESINDIDAAIAEERAEQKCYGYTKEDDGIGKWLSAALDDPRACDEFKADIRAWFDSKERAESAKPEPGDVVAWLKNGKPIVGGIWDEMDSDDPRDWNDEGLKLVVLMRAAGSQEHAEPAKPEPGDVVEPFDEWWSDGHSYLSERDAREIYSEFSGLMRAAEVRRKIEEGK